jgi:hypothetical protein
MSLTEADGTSRCAVRLSLLRLGSARRLAIGRLPVFIYSSFIILPSTFHASTPNAFPFLSMFPSMHCTLHSGCSTAAMPLPRPCNPVNKITVVLKNNFSLVKQDAHT